MQDILQLKIEIQGMNTWRKIFIESDATFQDLHQFVQKIYGWENHHLHEFLVEDTVRIASTKTESTRDKIRGKFLHRDDREVFEEEQTLLSEFLNTKGDSLVYRYDFGDDWRYDIVLESIQDRDYIEEYDEFPVKLEDNF